MKPKIILIIALSLCFFKPVLFAQYVNYPLTLANWTKMNTGSWEENAEGLKFNGSGYRVWNGIKTNTLIGCINKNVYIKWKPNGGGTYMGVGFSVDDIIGHDYTTAWSYGGSKVIPTDIWYYSRISINSDKTWTIITSTNNYDNSGGAFFHSKSGTLSASDFQTINSNFWINVSLWDNYGSTNCYVVVGELKTDGSSLEYIIL
jgi:hypothetical protein